MSLYRPTFTTRRCLGQLSFSRGLSTSRRRCKERVVVLGAGWGGFRVAKDLDKAKYDVSVVSPRNHFLFTPLLPSTTVGTLEFRCVQEPVRTLDGVHYHQARANGIDFEKQELKCTDVYKYRESKEGGEMTFSLPYDKLVIAVGAKSNTFGVPGIESREEELRAKEGATGTNKHNVFFLKDLRHARSIRNRILECFERACSPYISESERRRLLTFVIVGGGPTSIEFTSELCDFLHYDVSKWYSDLRGSYRVVVVEASKGLLGSFDSSLSQYVERLLKRRRVTVLTNETVKEVKDVSVVLGGASEEVPFGVCVWSTGNAPMDFTRSLDLPMTRDGRLLIDPCLRVASRENVFAIGDCAADAERPLTMLAQVANQQGIHLCKGLNSQTGEVTPFKYKFMGAMAQLGTFEAVADLNGPKLKGLVALLAWRSAYWTMSVSITNKILIPMYWFKSFFFGRDISKF